MKRLAVVIAGSDKEPLDIILHPGVTAWDILSAADLTDCVLSPSSDLRKIFAPEEVLYDLVENDQKLIAHLSTEVSDAYIRSFFNKE